MRKITRPCDKKIKTVGCVETVTKLERGKKNVGIGVDDRQRRRVGAKGETES